MLLSKLSNFIRNHLHLKVPMKVSVSDIPSCINDVPKYLILKSLNDDNVAPFRASPQLYAVGSHSCVSTAPIFFTWTKTFTSILVQALRGFFFFTFNFQRSLASSVMPRSFTVFEWGMSLSFLVIGISWQLLFLLDNWHVFIVYFFHSSRKQIEFFINVKL